MTSSGPGEGNLVFGAVVTRRWAVDVVIAAAHVLNEMRDSVLIRLCLVWSHALFVPTKLPESMQVVLVRTTKGVEYLVFL